MDTEDLDTETKITPTNGLWSDPAVPKQGWHNDDVIDLGYGSREICQMCQCRQIRYCHIMTHDHYESLAVGCVCAGHMSGDHASAHRREGEAKKRTRANEAAAEKLQAYQHNPLDWKRAQSGNAYTKISDELLIVVYTDKKKGGFKYMHIKNDKTKFFDARFKTEEEAQQAAEQNYLSKGL